MTIHLIFSCLLWLFLFQIFCGICVFGQCLDDQRLLLLQLNSTLKLVNWNPNDADCCRWDGVRCDGSGHVTILQLDNRSLSGDLQNSSALFGLQYLEILNLAQNSFSNTQIPKGIGNLTRLAYLNLSNAGFGGQVPIELSRLRTLEILDLSSQFQLAQPLKLEDPDLEMLIQNLTGLKELHLDGVNISAQGSDWCQSVSSLSNLRNLSLLKCRLSGPLQPSLLKLRSLSMLRLDLNNLSTTVPEFLAQFSTLTTLTLSFCNLHGTFPDKIFQVSTLQNLDLTNNMNLSGTISKFPPNGSFRSIVLSYTNFSGSLPDSISNLSKLSRVELSNCNFTGPIPSIIGNLPELVYLDFSFNSFNGSIPRFLMSKKLSYIDLSRNKLTGTLSPTHFKDLSDLVFINVMQNALEGPIPESFFGLPSLQKLHLSNNRFSGLVNEFPTSNSSNLDTLDLSSNQLEGSIPEAFFTLDRINVLSLSSNSFNGTIRLEKIQKLTNLTRLELGYNSLSVDASSNNNSNSSLLSFPKLSRLNLASCNLSSFPDFLKNQLSLTFLDLSNNHITGEIPSWIWEIGSGNLAHLNLSSNSLVGIQKPFTLPRFLSVLDLHSNSIQGEFPSASGQVIYVDYSNNSFQQPIPSNIGTFISYASFFSVARNYLSGVLPKSLCNATYLQVLDLSNNNLSGSIPPCLVGTLPNLGVLNLGRNSISGDIPDTFSANCTLKTLDFSRNNLGGKIPTSLSNCSSLEVVNVGNNKIDDGFPFMLKNSSNLRVLVLRNNRFHGDMSCSTVNESWPNLQIIDVASNNFSGYLSERCISNWKRMALGNDASTNHLSFGFLKLNNFYYQDTVTVTAKGLELEFVKILTVFTSIDFSNNHFQGEIPYTIGELSSLYMLNLSHNNFSGTIPKSIGNLQQLESLDLSDNQLTGEIPKELTNLTFLAFLNLSNNKLVGKIPGGRQFQTFEPSSYIGNTRLCGSPLRTTCDSDKAATAGPGLLNLKMQGFDWLFIFIGLGYGVGTALIIAPLAFSKQWRDECNKHLDEFLKLIYPRYGFSYVRYDGKVEAEGNNEGEATEDEEDDDEDTEYEPSRGRYCVFCTRLDTQLRRAIHNPKCTCHYSPPAFSSSHTSSSSSLLVIHHNF